MSENKRKRKLEPLTPLEKAVRESKVKKRRFNGGSCEVLVFADLLMQPEKQDYNSIRKCICEKTVRIFTLGLIIWGRESIIAN